MIDGAAIVTMDGSRREIADGYVVVQGNQIAAVGEGRAPALAGARVVDGRGCVVTPGFVNTHQHLYQWVTRGLAADATLFEWLTTLYPVWAGIDETSVHVAAQAALSRLALTGVRRRPTTTTSSPARAATRSPRRSWRRRTWACGSTRPAARWT